MSTFTPPDILAQYEQLKRDNELLRAKLEQAQRKTGGDSVESDITSALTGGSSSSRESTTQNSPTSQKFNEYEGFKVEPKRLPYKNGPPTAKDKECSNRYEGRSSTESSVSTASTVPHAHKSDFAVLVPSVSRKSYEHLPSTSTCVIQVESGLLGNLPTSLGVTEKRKPCAVFAVVDAETREVVWRFIKEYEQLRNFHDVIISILAPLIRTSKVRLSPFPFKTQKEDMFSTTALRPWHVDVRNDMLNAYFRTISWLSRNSAVHRNTKIRHDLDRAITALWLDNIVDPVPRAFSSDGDMYGFLLSRQPHGHGWKVRFYTLNGAFLDIQDTVGSHRISQTVPLHGARIQLKITFYDTSNGDERYAFTVYERLRKKAGYVAHHFSAENEATRQRWISELRRRVAQLDSGEVNSGRRFYNAEDLPVPYKSRESPHIAQYLKPEHQQASPARAIEMKSAKNPISIPISSPTTAEFTDTHFSGDRLRFKQELHNLTVYDNLYPVESSDKGQFFTYEFDKGSEKALNPDDSAQVSDAASEDVSPDKHRDVSRSQGQQTPGACSPRNGSTMHLARDTTKTSLAASHSESSGLSKVNCQTDNKHGAVFGVMPEHCKFLKQLDFGGSVPTVVFRCIERLRQPGAISEIGIFRTSGTQTQIDELQEEFDAKGDFDIVKAKIDVNTSADLLKRYLRTLPKCLFGDWNELKSKSLLALSEPDQINVLTIEMREIKGINRAVIQAVLSILESISVREWENAMSVRNLGVALSPALRVPAPVLEVFIKHGREVFLSL